MPKSKQTISPEEIRWIRRQLNETQRQFARRFDVEPVTVARWETSRRKCTGLYAMEIARLRTHAISKSSQVEQNEHKLSHAKKVAFVTYETPYSPCGGVSAVMGHLPGHFARASGLEALVVTPYHHRLQKTVGIESKLEYAGATSAPRNGSDIDVEILRYSELWPWFFLRPADLAIFAGEEHPYDLGEANLLRDSLFFGVAASRALTVIDPNAEWTLILQDWEAASAALVTADPAENRKCFLVLHNSYDHGVTEEDLVDAGISENDTSGHTVLRRALSVVEGPILTVSTQFSSELITDPLQSEVKAPHLKEKLTSNLAGINNGPFKKRVVPDDLLQRARRRDYGSLAAWKASNRESFRQAIGKSEAPVVARIWGDAKDFEWDEAPWLLMGGRDDQGQKGYELAAEAARNILERGHDARFLFFPIPGDGGLEGLEFLKKLAEDYSTSVLAFPFIFKAGFDRALQGSSFGLMPSLYEPFGMAHEFYLSGACCIGRATGGLIQQIVPLRAAASFSQAVACRVSETHSQSSTPTGILYREPDGIESAVDDWRALNSIGPSNASVRTRRCRTLPLLRAMTRELEIAVLDGIRIYHEDQSLFFDMIVEGELLVSRNFSWEQAGHEYTRAVRL